MNDRNVETGGKNGAQANRGILARMLDLLERLSPHGPCRLGFRDSVSPSSILARINRSRSSICCRWSGWHYSWQEW